MSQNTKFKGLKPIKVYWPMTLKLFSNHRLKPLTFRTLYCMLCLLFQVIKQI